MTNAQETYHQAYVKQVTADNVQPIIAPRGQWPEKLEGEIWTDKPGATAGWGDREYGPVYVRTSNMGRVMEVQSLMRGLTFMVAIHRTHDDYSNYRRPLGIFHYLHG